jgi:hypothetical protein
MIFFPYLPNPSGRTRLWDSLSLLTEAKKNNVSEEQIVANA